MDGVMMAFRHGVDDTRDLRFRRAAPRLGALGGRPADAAERRHASTQRPVGGRRRVEQRDRPPSVRQSPHGGISPATVARIWDARGLAPHRTRAFKLSNEPLFCEKLRDVVGLYLNPPERALVLLRR